LPNDNETLTHLVTDNSGNNDTVPLPDLEVSDSTEPIELNENQAENAIFDKTAFTYKETVVNKRTGKKKVRKVFRTWISLIIVIVLALILSVGSRVFLFEPFYIPSESMETTLMTGDKIVVEKLAPAIIPIKRGDIVVFKDPDNWLPPVPVEDYMGKQFLQFIGWAPQDGTQFLVKRAIGLPGDHIKCEGPGTKIKINGVEIDEPYIKAGSEPSETDFDVTVPEGHIWVMGDNRGNSADSRFHMDESTHGFVPISDVVGDYFLTIQPWSHFHFYKDYSYVFNQIP
jgi:signal peptidase I